MINTRAAQRGQYCAAMPGQIYFISTSCPYTPVELLSYRRQLRIWIAFAFCWRRFHQWMLKCVCLPINCYFDEIGNENTSFTFDLYLESLSFWSSTGKLRLSLFPKNQSMPALCNVWSKEEQILKLLICSIYCRVEMAHKNAKVLLK